MSAANTDNQCPVDISDDDVLAAMKKISGYLDITPADFREVYAVAYQQAMDRLNRSVSAEAVMTRKVVCVGTDTPLEAVAELMAAHNISGVPVLDQDGRVAGMISDQDFWIELTGQRHQSIMHLIKKYLTDVSCSSAESLKDRCAEHIMSLPAITVKGDATLTDIADLFNAKNINRVPVVDTGGKLIGIVTRSDIVGTHCAII
jgi:CBS domain-containing membrane protein